MSVKYSFSGIKNCSQISSEVLHESLSINRESEAIVYAKNTGDNESVFVVGNIEPMLCLIAEMIILMSKNSGFSISVILATISTIVVGMRGSLR